MVLKLKQRILTLTRFRKVAYNGFGLCVRWGFLSLKLNSSNNVKNSTND